MTQPDRTPLETKQHLRRAATRHLLRHYHRDFHHLTIRMSQQERLSHIG